MVGTIFLQLASSYRYNSEATGLAHHSVFIFTLDFNTNKQQTYTTKKIMTLLTHFLPFPDISGITVLFWRLPFLMHFGLQHFSFAFLSEHYADICLSLSFILQGIHSCITLPVNCIQCLNASWLFYPLSFSTNW